MDVVAKPVGGIVGGLAKMTGGVSSGVKSAVTVPRRRGENPLEW